MLDFGPESLLLAFLQRSDPNSCVVPRFCPCEDSADFVGIQISCIYGVSQGHHWDSRASIKSLNQHRDCQEGYVLESKMSIHSLVADDLVVINL